MTVTPDVLEETIVLVGEHPGVTVIPAGTVLTRLNHFDGMLLRSESLRVEQEYVRTLAALSNVAGGAGIVHGFDAVLQGDGGLLLGPGLAISPSGRPLVLPRQIGLSLQQIVDRSLRAPAPGGGVVGRAAEGFAECVDVATTPATGGQTVQSVRLWVIAIGAAEALCGHEDVYGKLCEDACSTASDRPYRLEGLTVVAVPLRLTVALASSGSVSLGAIHERSLVASAAFATERAARPDLRSRTGLASETWCLGARLEGGDDLVPVALVARSGASVAFLDAWAVRRELMETAPARCWQPRMGMRPRDVFLAQVLQFQCQLRDGLGGTDDPGNPIDPCTSQQQALGGALQYLGEIAARLAGGDVEALVTSGPIAGVELLGGATRLADVRRKLAAALHQVRGGTGQRILVDRGIVELPPAGFLPVVPGTTTSIDAQVRALMGPGVDLRFCVTRPDVVGHEIEAAQHMDRISLLTGLDDPDMRPEVDVLVPDGELVTSQRPGLGLGFDVTLLLAPRPSTARVVEAPAEDVPSGSTAALRGAGRADPTDAGGWAFRFAGATELGKGADAMELLQGMAGLRRSGDGAATIASLPAMSSLQVAQRGSDPSFAMRMRALGAEAAHGSAERRAGAVDDSAAVKLATRMRGDVVALWLDASCAGDPFALAAGERTSVRVVLDVTAPKDAAVLRSKLHGDLLVSDVVPDDRGGRRLTGRLQALGYRDAPTGLPGVEPESVEVDLPLTLTAGPDPSGQIFVELALRLDDEHDLRIAGTASPGERLRLDVNVVHSAHASLGPKTPLARATLLEEPGVADAAHVAHGLSRSALELLGVGLQDPAFAGETARLLFAPAPTHQAGSTSVRGVRDWVAFHRRRPITCPGPAVIPPRAPVAPASYAVFAFVSRDNAAMTRLATALNSASIGPLGGFALRQIGRVEFAGDSEDLLTAIAAIRSDWQASAPGERIMLTAIGEHAGAAGDPGRLERRLKHVLGAISPITPIDPSTGPTVLAGVPPALAVPGTAGVIVLASLVEHTTTCISAFRVPRSIAATFRERFEAGDRTGALALVSGGDGSLGQLTFAEGHAAIEPGGIDVVAQMLSGAALPKSLETLAFVWREGDAVGLTRALTVDRVTNIAIALGRPDVKLEGGPVSSALPGACPVAVFLVPPTDIVVPPSGPRTTCMTVFRVPAEEGEAAVLMAKLDRGDIEGALLGALAAGPGGGPVKLGVVSFDEDATTIIAGTEAQGVRTAWQRFPDDLENLVVFSRSGDAAAGSPPQRAARGRALAAELGHVGGVVPNVTVREVGAAASLPSGCPTVAYLLPSLDSVPGWACHTVRLVKATEIEGFVKWIEENGELHTVDFLVEEPAAGRTEFLGNQRFLLGSADPFVEEIQELKDKFDSESRAPIVSVTVMSKAGDPRAGIAELRRERAQIILGGLGIVGAAVQIVEPDAEIPGTLGSCPVITLLIPDLSKAGPGGG